MSESKPLDYHLVVESPTFEPPNNMPNPTLHFPIFLILTLTTLLETCTGSFPPDHFAQQESDRVPELPGQDFTVSFEQYAGYITVNEGSGRALFYWLTEAVDHRAASKPLVLWLQGGPGCSSIGFGMAEEIGPFRVNRDGKSLYFNPYSWNQAANILFVDSPAGVGYSYSNTSSDIVTNGDKRTATDSLAFLLKWFERFPQYQGREFYITGESYAGHYIPQLSQAIVNHNSVNMDGLINFKGYMVGNALTDDYNDHLGVFQFMWSAGMISSQTYKQLNEVCDFQSFIFPSEECHKLLDIADEEVGNVDCASIFTPPCTVKFGVTRHLSERWRKIGRISQSYDPCTGQHSTIYFNLPEVQKALHVYHRNTSTKWATCSAEVTYNYKDTQRSILNIYRELIQSGIRIWMFSGDTDAVIPTVSTRYNIDALKLPTVGPFRAWYDDGQVGGWTQQYEGLTFVTVRGAGHEVALLKPKQALTLFKSFLSGTPMPTLEKTISTSEQTRGSESSLLRQVADS